MKPISRQKNLVVQNADNETLVYDLQNDKAYLLNETSALIWNLCDGTRDLAQISQAVAKKNTQPVNEEIVWLAIDGLKKSDLMSNETVLPSAFAQTTRREIIKKVGLTTMIALPLVSTLVAPTAASAASGNNLAACAVCTSNAQCANNRCVPNIDPAGSGMICSNGTSTTQALPVGYTTSTLAAGGCNTLGTQGCCDGSSTFTPAAGGNPRSCTC